MYKASLALTRLWLTLFSKSVVSLCSTIICMYVPQKFQSSPQQRLKFLFQEHWWSSSLLVWKSLPNIFWKICSSTSRVPFRAYKKLAHCTGHETFQSDIVSISHGSLSVSINHGYTLLYYVVRLNTVGDGKQSRLVATHTATLWLTFIVRVNVSGWPRVSRSEGMCFAVESQRSLPAFVLDTKAHVTCIMLWHETILHRRECIMGCVVQLSWDYQILLPGNLPARVNKEMPQATFSSLFLKTKWHS